MPARDDEDSRESSLGEKKYMYELENRMLFDAALATDVAAAADAAQTAPAQSSGPANDGDSHSDVDGQSHDASAVNGGTVDSDGDGGDTPDTGGDAPDSGGASPTDSSDDGVYNDGGSALSASIHQGASDNVTDSGDTPGTVSALLAEVAESNANSVAEETSLLIIDSTVPDAEALAASAPDNVEVHILDPGHGVSEITSILESRSEGVVSSLNIVSHGNQGEIVLGFDLLNPETLPAYSAELAKWNAYLSDGADITLSACGVAEGVEGRAFVDAFATATGADVAASTDDVGGSDWSAEYAAGTIESANSLADVEGYAHSLRTYTVRNTRDWGWGSLRNAIDSANNHPGADVITFRRVSGTIALNNGEIPITDDLTIAGPGAATLAVDAQGNSRVFNINDGDGGNNIDVAISGLTLENGYSSGDGGIIRSAENLALDSCVLTGGEANNGAAIYVKAPSAGVSLSASDTDFNDNAADNNGGALYLLNLDNANITGGESRDNSAGTDGGAVYTRNVPLTVDSVDFIDNDAGDKGGAIRHLRGDLAVQNGTFFDGNTAGDRGGAIHNNVNTGSGETFSFVDSSANSNTSAGHGGAIYNANADFTVDHSILSNNKTTDATAKGGALYNYIADLAIQNSSEIDGNSAYKGGGVFNVSSGFAFSIDSSTISNNISDDDGGGVYNINAAFSTNAADVDGNVSGHNGGGIYTNTPTVVSGGVISNNTADNHGGGIFATSKLTIQNSATISGNTATNGRGGGVYFSNNTESLGISDSSINSNHADSGGGGGVYVHSPLVETVNSTFDGNTANKGGGLYAKMNFDGAKASSSNDTFTNNSAALDGGGMYVTTLGNSNFVGETNGTDFNGNTAGRDGGAMYVSAGDGADITLGNGSLLSNTANDDGGALYVSSGDNTQAAMNNIVMRLNSAADLAGAFYFKTGGNSAATMNGTTIYENTASPSGEGIYLDLGQGTTTSRTNSSWYNNDPKDITYAHGYQGEPPPTTTPRTTYASSGSVPASTLSATLGSINDGENGVSPGSSADDGVSVAPDTGGDADPNASPTVASAIWGVPDAMDAIPTSSAHPAFAMELDRLLDSALT